jgi:hypothetical protein
MHKQWLAMLSVIGLAGSGARVQGQVLKGSTNPAKGSQATKNTNQVKTSNSANSGKLSVNQQTLRQQNQGGAAGSQNYPPTTVGGKNAVTKGNASVANNAALTKGNGNAALTKAKTDAAITKGGTNNQLTKAKTDVKSNAALTKGTNSQLTKGANSQFTKASNSQLTKGANSQLTKGANNQLTKATNTK